MSSVLAQNGRAVLLRKILGVVRLHDDPGGESAEFAILVRSPAKASVGYR
jgi:hypothetical protein